MNTSGVQMHKWGSTVYVINIVCASQFMNLMQINQQKEIQRQNQQKTVEMVRN